MKRFALFLFALVLPVLGQSSNCIAVALNGDLFQPGDTITARLLPGSCGVSSLDIHLGIERYASTEWVSVARRSVPVRGITYGQSKTLASFTIPAVESEWLPGLYRMVVAPAAPPDPFWAYRETPVFFVGERPVPWQEFYTLPPEYHNAPFLNPAHRASDGSLHATGKLGASGKVVAWFFQFGSGSTDAGVYRQDLTPVERGDFLSPVSVMLPNTFSVSRPVYVHLVCASTGVATSQLFFAPRLGFTPSGSN